MPALGRGKTIAEIEPADHDADVEGRGHRIEFEARAGHFDAVGIQGSRHDGPQQFHALGKVQRFHGTSERIDEAVAGHAIGFGARDRVALHIMRHVRERLVRCGTDVGIVSGHFFLLEDPNSAEFLTSA